MNKILFFLLILSNAAFAQIKFNSRIPVPKFNEKLKFSNPEESLEHLNFGIQDYIAEHMDSSFVKTYFKPQDSIEFNFNLIIDKFGNVNSINVNTEVDLFNQKIKNILQKINKFIPAKAVNVNENLDFYFSLSQNIILINTLGLNPFTEKYKKKLYVLNPEKPPY
ncbi:hypothetical protein N7U66_09790 [Lacinutrix neustonica]|uniref:Beta-lactamase-inhibitor-like PepSY-like domain-containing protein n=1 Tax=Lacinutrix neustonica TaxID=2980107 RepID=A0A9E8MXV2_9FLAO|nr:hypothetical protein [Lacinutrix neustonica]WAC03697.1 hypothetical protein N7U66_09790 [Lacinutrix neustonica]